MVRVEGLAGLLGSFLRRRVEGLAGLPWLGLHCLWRRHRFGGMLPRVRELVAENEITVVLLFLFGWMLLFLGLTDVSESKARLERSNGWQRRVAQMELDGKREHFFHGSVLFVFAAVVIVCVALYALRMKASRRRLALPFQARALASYASTSRSGPLARHR